MTTFQQGDRVAVHGARMTSAGPVSCEFPGVVDDLGDDCVLVEHDDGTLRWYQPTVVRLIVHSEECQNEP